MKGRGKNRLQTELWAQYARCANHPEPNLWFPTSRSRKEDIDRAKDICHVCPVRIPCWQYGTINQLEGIWGGEELPTRLRKLT